MVFDDNNGHKLKIGLFARSLAIRTSGAARVVLGMAQFLEDKGHEVVLFTNEYDPETFPQLKDKQVICWQTPFFTSNPHFQRVIDLLPANLLFLRNNLKKLGIDTMLFFDMPYMVLLVKALYRIPCLLHMFSPLSAGEYIKKHWILRRMNWLLKFFEKRIVYPRFDAILTISRTAQDNLKNYLGLESQVLYDPVDTKHFSPDFNIKSDDLLVSVCKFVPGQEHDNLIKLFRRMPGDYRLVLVGGLDKAYNDYFTYLKKLADDDPRVNLISNATDEELLRLYRQAALFVYIYRWEHFGYCPVEAMACGTPVVALKGGGLNETVDQGETGVLCDTEDELIEEARTLLANRERRLEMGRIGSERTTARFGSSAIGGQLETAVFKIIQGHNRTCQE